MSNGDPQYIPSFKEVMQKPSNGNIPSFDEVMEDGDGEKKKESGGGFIGSFASKIGTKPTVSTSTSVKENNNFDEWIAKLPRLEVESKDPIGDLKRTTAQQLRALYPDVTTGKKENFNAFDFVRKTKQIKGQTNSELKAFNELLDSNPELAEAELQKRLSGKIAIPQRETINNPLIRGLNQSFVPQIEQPIADVTQIPVEELKKIIDPNNQTEKLLVSKIEKGRKFNEVLNNATSIKEKASQLYYGTSYNVNKESKTGNAIDRFLHDPLTIKKAESDPQFKIQYDNAKNNLYKEYPDYAISKLGTDIAQKLEDERMTGWFYANPSSDKIKKAVDMLIKEGKWDEREMMAFEKIVVPAIAISKATGRPNDVIPTTDFIHNFGTGVEDNLERVAATFRDITNKITGGFFQNVGLIETNEDRAERLDEENYKKPSVEAVNQFRKTIQGGSHFAGFTLPMILGGQAKIPQAITMGLTFEGKNADHARELFPKNREKQFAYTALGTLIDVTLAELLPIKKIGNSIANASIIKKDAAATVEELSAKKITEQQAKERIEEKIFSYSKRFLADNAKTATVVTAFETAHNGLEAIFGKKDFRLMNEFSNFISSYKTNFLNSSFLSAISAVGVSRQSKGQIYREIADNNEMYRELLNKEAEKNPESAKEKLENLEYLSKINKSIKEIPALQKDAARELYLSEAMKEKVAEDAIKSTPDKVLNKADEKILILSAIDKERLLNPEMTNTEYTEKLYNAELLPKGFSELLEVDGKFAKGKMGEFLKYIAQQANNVNAEGKPEAVKGKTKATDNLPPTLVEIANEMNPEYKEAAERFEIQEAEKQISEPTIENFAERISKGEKMDSPEDIQFYENNKEAIEQELKNKALNNLSQDNRKSEAELEKQKPNETTPQAPIEQNPFVESKIQEPVYRANTGGKFRPNNSEGAYFTTNKEYAELYAWDAAKGERVEGMEVEPHFVDLKNPLRITTKGSMGEAIRENIEKAKENGHDGIIVTDPSMPSANEVFVFNDSQIKKVNSENTKASTQANESIPSKEKSNTDATAIEGSETAKEGGAVPPKEPPKVGASSVFVERPATELSHKGLQDVANEFSLPDVKTRDRKTDIQLRQDAINTSNEWAEKGEYAENVERLTKDAESGKILTDEERVIMEIHLANLSSEIRSIDKTSPEFDKKLSEIRRLKDAGEKTRSEAGAALRIPFGGSRPHPVTDLADAMVAKMEANSVDVLTDTQKKQVEQEVKFYEEKAKVAEQKVADLEAKMAEMEAGKVVKDEATKVVSKSKQKKKTSEDYKNERKSYVEELKSAKEEHEKWLKEQGIHTKGGVPGFVLTPKMVKVIGKIVKSYAEEVGNNLAEITQRVFDEIKSYFPGITHKDVHDVIAGVYNEKRQTKTDLQIILRDLRDEAALMNKLEVLLSGAEPKSEKAKIERNARIKELRDKIKAVQKEKDESENTPKEDGIPDDLKALLRAKKRNQQITKEIIEKINNKDFETKPKPASIFDNPELKKKYPKEYQEMLDAIVAKEDAKHKFALELYKDEQSKRGKVKKAIDFAGKLIHTSRAIVSGIDDSFTFVQAGMAMLANPKSGIKAWREHWKDAISEKRFNRELAKLHNSEYWDLIQKSGVDVLEPQSLDASKVEEAFNKNLFANTKVWRKTGGIFERAFTSIGNNLRVNLFLKRAEQLQNDGKTFESHPQEYKDAARVVNEMTGRGKMNKYLEQASPLITPVIWSPRMIASSFNLLGVTDAAYYLTGQKGGYYRTLTPAQRKYAITQLAKGIGMGVSIMSAAALGGAKVDSDPESVTFGNIKTGTKSYNVFGRLTPYVKTIVQSVTGRRKRPDGTEQNLDSKKMGAKTRVGMWGGFLRGKTTPFAGAMYDLAEGKNYFTGEEFGIKDVPQAILLPMSVQELRKGLSQDGTISLLTRFIPSFEGLKVTDDRDFKDRKFSSIKHNDEKIDLTDDQQEEFKADYTKKSSEFLEKLKGSEKYKNAGKEEKEKLQVMINREALNEAEDDLKKKYPAQFPRLSPEKMKEKKEENKELERLKKDIGIGRKTPIESE